MMFNEKIRLLRKKNGISQEELAEKLDITRQAVTKWESGCVVPDVLNLIKLSELFRVTIDYLVKDDDTCHVFAQADKLDANEIKDFLFEAKQRTYAANEKTDPSSLRPTSRDYCFRMPPFYYHDTYVGNQTFIGEELVYKNETPIWAMGYCGKVLDASFSSGLLKESLRLLSPDMPIRGPANYHSGAYYYQCTQMGDFEWFTGKEEIYYGKIKVFELSFYGGILD